ncbi:MAG: DUF1801 domain-containing protein [Phycisphaerales bacterium]
MKRNARTSAKKSVRKEKPATTRRVATKIDAASPAARLIDERIAELDDWRGATLARVRAIVRQAEPNVVEEWKWRGVPVWSHAGIICTGETYKDVVKLTFAKGAALPDPSRLFNASLDGNTRRAIDIREGDAINAIALKAIIRAAVALNATAKPKRTTKATPAAGGPMASKRRRAAARPALLAGGNPQISKAAGDAPVRAYIAAMPGWKRTVGERLDAIITRAVPGVRKAVKWNSPLYGIADESGGDGLVGNWFVGVHCFAKYVKVAFFDGASLRPPPPGASKQKNVRYLDIREGDSIDESQLEAWVRQAAALPGERM